MIAAARMLPTRGFAMCGAIALAVAITMGEAAVAYAYGFAWGHLSYALVMVAAVLAMPRWPMAAAILVLIADMIAPMLPFHTSGMLGLAVIVALAAIGYRHTIVGLCAAVLAGCAESWSFVTMFGLPASRMLAPNQLMNLVYYAGFAVLGVLLRQAVHAERLRHELRLSRWREATAARLHDRICNDLSCLVLRVDQINNGEDQNLAGIRQGLADALNDVRAVVSALESPHTRDAAVLRVDDGLQARLQGHVGRLADLGIQGEVLCADGIEEGLDEQGRNLALSAVDELFGNIAKYASPEDGYTFVIQRDAATLTISVADTPNHSKAPSGGGGSGMARLRRSAEALGGSCVVESSPEAWSCQLRIPYA
ncbi:sensor histidine kinase [Bifidobacterium eulemuris]|uniref:histidine kinase n=1 Tax=Bifidobacterium eulemuris TaxID=1765219 RepID=A0A261G526_9BIFI|nr:hypothetical protein [Bifidobacterium eulemuris]OZG66494.1 histidine kinase [Bifidobacterium eulemuris]QOL32590.1 hypothetical protein BE0216_09170 [Bifidobacterium eulemuris]